MRLREHSKADLALTALTLSVAAAATVSEVVRWVGGRRHRPDGPGDGIPPAPHRSP